MPLGTCPALEARGLPPTGTFNIGGPVMTAGGLVFIAGTKDKRIRAFDKTTGEELWHYHMDGAGYATPAHLRLSLTETDIFAELPAGLAPGSGGVRTTTFIGDDTRDGNITDSFPTNFGHVDFRGWRGRVHNPNLTDDVVMVVHVICVTE